MTNITPEMTEEEKKANTAELSDDVLENVGGGAEMLRRGDSPSPKPSNNAANELSDEVLDNVAGGTAVRSAFNLQLDDATSQNFTRADAYIVQEKYCSKCQKNTVFHIPNNGMPFCSVCKQPLVSVVEAPFITE